MPANYPKNLFKQFEEALIKIDFLMEENKLLKFEIASLKADHKTEIIQLNSKVESLENENIKLKIIINKDSSNSSKPPSSDGYKSIPNSREKTGKAVGSQQGHKGKTLLLFDKPTQIIEHKALFCQCGSHINYGDEYKAKQFVDIEIKTNIIEHRVLKGVCPSCQAKSINQFPRELINTVTYGNSLKSLSALLFSEGIVSTNRIRQIINELTEGIINLSEGTIVNFNNQLSTTLEPVIKNIKEQLLVSPVNHKDESGIKVNKSSNWIHVLSNKSHTLYFTHAKRGNAADNEIGVLPSYSGTLVHDHLKGLYKFNCQHAECNAHILRYLKSAVESQDRLWASKMIELLVLANNSIKELKAQSIFGFSQDTSQYYFDRYDEILLGGHKEFLADSKKDYNSEDMKLLRRLEKYKKEHLKFIVDFNVPFDNNLAERDLRMIKAKAKISGCFRSDTGGETFATIKSYTSTLRKNSQNIYQGIRLAFGNNPIII